MSESASLLSTVIRRLRGAELNSEHRLLVAFSGGLDSSVLVDLIDRARLCGGPALELIHVDHGLRPDSGDDARFCIEQAARRGLPIHIERLGLDKSSTGQAEARRRRLAAIADQALRLGIRYVALGHHGDDRIETFLFHLRRGTGLDGLATMQADDPFPIDGLNLRILRPLVTHTRRKLEDYARHRSIAHVVDPTNTTDAYTRNRIRHHLVPQLAEGESRRHTILDAIDNLDEERRAAQHYAQQLARQARRPMPGLRSHAFCRSQLADAPRATVARLFQNLEPTLDAASIEKIHGAIEGPVDNGAHHLTLSRCVITVVGERVIFHPSEERGGRDVLNRQVHPIALLPFARGSAPFFGSTLRWNLIDADHCPEPNFDDSPWTATFDADRLHTPLEATGFRPGARLPKEDATGGIYHQKLTKIFRAHGVDAHLRWRWPCIYDAHQKLVWAAGLDRSAAAIRPSHNGPRWRLRILPSREIIEILQS